MYNRRILYGYIIQNGELAIEPEEAQTVRQIFTVYLAGLSYQRMADKLNGDNIPFSDDVPDWNKHKVKRLLENPRYIGEYEYPPIMQPEIFEQVKLLIQAMPASSPAGKSCKSGWLSSR